MSNAVAYELLAADYHWLYDDVELRLGTPTPGVRAALAGLRPGARVLDAACGIGLDAVALHRRGLVVTASDANSNMLVEARSRLAAEGCGVELVQSEWSDLRDRLQAASFDAVLCTGNSIAHLSSESEMVEVFEVFFDLVVPGGVLIMDTHDWEEIERIGDCTIVDPAVVERNGAQCVRTYTWRRVDGAWQMGLRFEISDGDQIEERVWALILHPFSVRDLHERLRSVGFVEVSIDAAPGEDRYSIVARRPRG